MQPNDIQKLGALLKTTAPTSSPGVQAGTVSQLSDQTKQWGTQPTTTPQVIPVQNIPPKSNQTPQDTSSKPYNLYTSYSENLQKSAANLGQNWAAAPSQFGGDVNQIASGFQKGGNEGLKDFGEGLLSLLGHTVSQVYAPLSAVTEGISNTISDNPTVQKIAGSSVGKPLDIINKLNDWAKAHPEAAKNLTNAVNVGTAVLGDVSGGNEKIPNPKEFVQSIKAASSPTIIDASKLSLSQNYPTLNKSLPLDDSEFKIIEQENPGLIKLMQDGKAPPIPVKQLPDGTFEPFGDGGTRAIIAKHLNLENVPIKIVDKGSAISANLPKDSSMTPTVNTLPKQNVPGIMEKANTLGDSLIDKSIKAIDEVTGNFKSPNFKPTPETINDYITKTYDKAIKPTVVGNKNPGALEAYRAKTVSGVNSIVDNKANLNFLTEDGVKETGRLPQSLNETVDAIEQTKTGIFQKYDALAKSAGEKGALVDFTKTIAPELDAIINDKALSISHPEAISYAEGLKVRLEKIGSVDPATAQQVIQNYNNSLKNFYRNPSYESTSKAAIDALVANKTRVALDSTIENTTGEKYQNLKNQYGALKAIESDVTKRALVDSRKNVKGLIDYTDILSGGDVVRGIVTADPTLFAKGIAQKGIAAFYKYLNDPNRQISKMFETVDQLKNPQ